nr:hypothetical protein CFP56_32832 [Quercus suber]
MHMRSCQSPLSFTSLLNSFVWTATPNGSFSMRSAYKVAQEYCSDSSNMVALWKSVWSVKCLNKIRNFIWEACKDIPLVKTSLILADTGQGGV